MKYKLENINKNILNNKSKEIKIYTRNCNINSIILNKIFLIHNGKEFKKLRIKNEHFNYNIGDFIFTRKKCIHKIKKENK